MPLVPGSFAAWGRTFSQKTNCAEQDVGNLKNCTFWNFGTPVRRTDRRKSQKLHFQEFWDSCAQYKTSEISKHALSGLPGLLCAEQDVDNLKKMHCQELWDSCAHNKTSKISKHHFQELWDSCAQNKMSEISKNEHIWAHMWDTFRTHLERMEHIAAHLRTPVGDN